MMRTMLLALTALIAFGAALVGDPRASAARPWRPWCAMYATNNIGSECLFASWAQCMETVRGIGGTCVQNWTPPPVVEPRHRRGHNRWWPFYPD
jgi:hypothetical protein